MNKLAFLLYTFSLILFASCQSDDPPGSVQHIEAVTSVIDDGALVGATENESDWLSYGRDYKENRFSQISQINKTNVTDLNLAWALDLDVMRGFEATPVVIDGIMFLTGPWSVVYAIDARKGSLIWTYDPEDVMLFLAIRMMSPSVRH